MAAQKSKDSNWKEKALNMQHSAKSSKILAKSFYNELKTNGYTRNEILAFSSEILGLVTCDLRQKAS